MISLLFERNNAHGGIISMVQFSDVGKTYGNGIKALRGVSFTLQDGEFSFLVGPSGSGKSTIIKLSLIHISARRQSWQTTLARRIS